MKASPTAFALALVLLAAGRSPAGPAQPTPSPKPDPEQIRARERMVLLDVRTLVMAARQYAAANGSFVDELRCLGQPELCIPGYPKDSPSFIDPSYDFLRTRLGYVRQFHPGSRPDDEQIRQALASATSLRSFAYTAVPEKAGETGFRGFCGDSGGRLCFTSDGSPPPVKDGRCATPCQPLK